MDLISSLSREEQLTESYSLVHVADSYLNDQFVDDTPRPIMMTSSGDCVPWCLLFAGPGVSDQAVIREEGWHRLAR